MSHVEFLREGYRLLNEERRTDPAMYADDFVLEQSADIVGTRGTFHGRAGAQAALDELFEGFDEVRFEPVEFEVHGDWVIVVTRMRASVRGIEETARVVHLWRLRGGLASYLGVYASRRGARAVMERVGGAA